MEHFTIEKKEDGYVHLAFLGASDLDENERIQDFLNDFGLIYPFESDNVSGVKGGFMSPGVMAKFPERLRSHKLLESVPTKMPMFFTLGERSLIFKPEATDKSSANFAQTILNHRMEKERGTSEIFITSGENVTKIIFFSEYQRISFVNTLESLFS